jgi:hypothetical protein
MRYILFGCALLSLAACAIPVRPINAGDIKVTSVEPETRDLGKDAEWARELLDRANREVRNLKNTEEASDFIVKYSDAFESSLRVRMKGNEQETRAIIEYGWKLEHLMFAVFMSCYEKDWSRTDYVWMNVRCLSLGFELRHLEEEAGIELTAWAYHPKTGRGYFPEKN